MPKKDQTGPPKNARGPRDGRGKGQGYHSDEGKGIGKQKGGKRNA